MSEPNRDEPLTDDDGMPLLTMEEIADLLGWKVATVRNYNAAGRRARGKRRRGEKPGKSDWAAGAEFPPFKRKVRRSFLKANGQRGEVPTPVWRRDAVAAYAAARGLTLRGEAAGHDGAQ